MYFKMITVILFVLFQVAKSERIVVIGGGPVGLELAGELATDYPNKKITIMHNREQILDDRMASKFVKKISDGLRALKIETVLGERVDMDDLNVSQNTFLFLYKILTYSVWSLYAEIDTVTGKVKMNSKIKIAYRCRVLCLRFFMIICFLDSLIWKSRGLLGQ